MRRASMCFLYAMGTYSPAFAGNSYVLPDGKSRAAAVTVHCATGPGTAVACGTQAQPLVVTAPPGAATSANQGAEISTQQGISQALGTQNDPIYTNGPGSMVSLLKAVESALIGGVQSVPVGGQPISRSVTVGSASSAYLFQSNPTRHYLAFQAPQTSFIWVNFLGGTAAPNALNCVYFAAGSFYESGQYVTHGAVSIYSPVAANISAWEG